MTLALKIQKVEFVILVILMNEQVNYIIISEAPKKAAYHSDMQKILKIRNYKETTKNTLWTIYRGIPFNSAYEKKLFKISHISGEK